jgi:mannose-6-phosphate isomerase class I
MNDSTEDLVADPFMALLPERMKTFPRGPFDTSPSFKILDEKIEKGYEKLGQKIKDSIPNGLRVLMVDGFQGIKWNEFQSNLKKALIKLDVKPAWLNMEDCLLPAEEIKKKIDPFLGGDDPIFGTHYPFGPEVFFDPKKIAEYRIEASIARAEKAGNLLIIYGIGASLIELWDELWYIDIPKDLIQEYAREGEIKNIGEKDSVSFGNFYKRSYFVEWPALNRLKKNLLPFINYFIDFQDSLSPSFMSGDDFRESLTELSVSPFRLRPWFYPGPWGGKFMQGHMGLDPEQPNFAWSFEMIVPENGVILESSGDRLEFSFDCLMYLHNKKILGENAAKQFKYEWPIRLDYLDTIDGGNLSTQLHPRANYIRKEFGETYTQDETYYIVASKPDAQVYLGLTEECDLDEFKSVLKKSGEEGIEVDIDKYVHKEPSKPHDLFCIPNGTVHCSGEGNLVLEISATPYIFTFKIYDYLRRDLEGNLRPINLERGFKNIRGERRSSWVKKNLLAKPALINNGDGWEEYELYNKPYSFYKIHRIEFTAKYEMDTNGTAYAINLVDGEEVEIISENGRVSKLSYLESMLIPAEAGKLKIINKGKRPCKIIKVYIRPGIGISERLNDPTD